MVDRTQTERNEKGNLKTHSTKNDDEELRTFARRDSKCSYLRTVQQHFDCLACCHFSATVVLHIYIYIY